MAGASNLGGGEGKSDLKFKCGRGRLMEHGRIFYHINAPAGTGLSGEMGCD